MGVPGVYWIVKNIWDEPLFTCTEPTLVSKFLASRMSAVWSVSGGSLSTGAMYVEFIEFDEKVTFTDDEFMEEFQYNGS